MIEGMSDEGSNLALYKKSSNFFLDGAARIWSKPG